MKKSVLFPDQDHFNDKGFSRKRGKLPLINFILRGMVMIIPLTFLCSLSRAPKPATSSLEVFTNNPPIISTHPVDKIVCDGATFTFEITATGSNLNFQWEISNNNIQYNLLPSTTTSYSGTASPGLDGRYFRCVVCCGNDCVTSNAAQLILGDINDPSITCPTDFSVQTPTGSCTVPPADYTSMATVMDDCDPSPTVTQMSVAGGALVLGPNTITLEAKDASTNTSTCTFEITLEDQIPPLLSGICGNQETLATNTNNCNGTLPDYTGFVSISDNCTQNLSGVQTPSPGTQIMASMQQVTMHATDGSGNQASCTFMVELQDQTPPDMQCLNATIYLDLNGSAMISSADLDGGISDNCGTPMLSLSQSSFSCSDSIVTINVFAVDPYLNEDSCSSIITVLDTFPPEARCQDLTLNLDQNGLANINPSDLNNGSTDNCNLTFQVQPATLTCSNLGTNTVQLRVSDKFNTDSCTATVTIQDNTPPTLICRNDTVFLDGSGNGSITFNDLIPDPNSSQIDIFIQTDNFPEETSWMIVNAMGTIIDSVGIGRYRNRRNDSIHIQQILPCGQDYQFFIMDSYGDGICCSTGQGGFQVLLNTILIDSGGTQFSIDSIPIDLTPCPSATGDNCPIAPSSIQISQTAFDCSHLEENTVTIITTDPSLNSDTCSTLVTVLDTFPPAAGCRDTTLYLNTNGIAAILPQSINDGSQDNCGIDSMQLSQNSWNCTALGINHTILIVFDESGNLDSCSAQITIEDTIKPEAICRNIDIYLDSLNQASVLPGDLDGGSSDNCSIALSIIQSQFTCQDIGANPIILMVTDGVGFLDSCTAMVQVLDTISPKAYCKDTLLYLDALGQAHLLAEAIDSGSTDNCSFDRVEINQSTFDCLDFGNNEIIFTALDSSGNTHTCISTITIEDTFSISAGFTYTAGSNGLTYTFTDQSTGGIVGWNWDFGDGTGTSTQQSPTYTYTSETVVEVKLIVTDGCRQDTTRQFIVLTGIDQLSGEHHIRGFPNPNHGTFHLNFQGVYGNTEVEIYNMKGQLIGAKYLGRIPENHQETLVLPPYLKGIFLLKINVDGQFFLRKIIAE